MLFNKSSLPIKEFNCVTYSNGEFHISGRKLQEKIVPKNKIPRRKKIRNAETSSAKSKIGFDEN